MSKIQQRIQKLKTLINGLKVNSNLADDEKDLGDILGLMEDDNNYDGEVNISTCNTPVIGLLLNKNFGLREIKKEIIGIENKLNSIPECKFLALLKKIEKLLKNPCFGLKEIKKEVKDIEDKLDNPDFGLEEIKNEIRDIEDKLDNPDFGLAEIKDEIRDIEDKLDNPDFGLAEIKDEIRDIEDKLDRLVPFSGTLTTGPVIADNGVNSVVSKVFNNTDEEVTVTARLFNIGTCPDPKTLIEEQELVIDPKCALDHIFPKPSTQWEIEYEGIIADVFVFTAGRSNGADAPLSSSQLNPANTFRHSEHIPTTDP